MYIYQDLVDGGLEKHGHVLKEARIALKTVDRIYKKFFDPKIKAKDVLEILRILNLLNLRKVIFDSVMIPTMITRISSC